VPTLSKPPPELFLGIVDAAPDALVVVDAAGQLQFANARAEVFLGRARGELVGRSIAAFVPGADAAVAELLAEGAADHRVELTAACPPGSDVPVEVWLSRISGVEGLVAVAVRDDTERRAMRETSARLREELIASVSHELRTPLTSIIGYTELLADMGEHAVSGQAAELLAVIERNAERELRLVEDLLTLAALGTARLDVDHTPTDLVVVVAEVVAALSDNAAEAGVELRCTQPEELWVSGDALRLAQMVTNLVTNAVKFTGPGGRVLVDLSAASSHGVLTVADQGVGVPADEVPLVFEGFFRGAHAVDRNLPGAGLGLPIVKGIVDAHGGEIDVDSACDRGTTVEIRLPLTTR
jgi:protein-histidine pros-kinase